MQVSSWHARLGGIDGFLRSRGLWQQQKAGHRCRGSVLRSAGQSRDRGEREGLWEGRLCFTQGKAWLTARTVPWLLKASGGWLRGSIDGWTFVGGGCKAREGDGFRVEET